MRVLIVGASGFIGAALARRLSAARHDVICVSRRPPPTADRGAVRTFAIDYSRRETIADAAAAGAFDGVDVVVNAVGILRESDEQTFDALHARGPQELFAAAAHAGVRRVIQISALGADAAAPAEYHRSKHAADAFLMGLAVDWAIVQPSLVYGAGGGSARLFDSLASLPVTPLPGDGSQRVQPVHLDDLLDAVVQLIQSPAAQRCVLPVVGPEPLTMRDFFAKLRVALGFTRARFLPVPLPLVKLGALMGSVLPGILLDRDTLAMLTRGNVGDPAPLTQLLGRPPRRVEEFIAPAERASRGVEASMRWAAALLRLSIAAMWLVAGIVSLGPYPVSDSLELLQGIGIPAALAPLALYGAAALDLLLGLLTLLPRRPRGLWAAQIALVLAYTVIITARLPALWLEPFGPVAKNLPILAALLLLQRLERRA